MRSTRFAARPSGPVDCPPRDWCSLAECPVCHQFFEPSDPARFAGAAESVECQLCDAQLVRAACHDGVAFSDYQQWEVEFAASSRMAVMSDHLASSVVFPMIDRSWIPVSSRMTPMNSMPTPNHNPMTMDTTPTAIDDGLWSDTVMLAPTPSHLHILRQKAIRISVWPRPVTYGHIE